MKYIITESQFDFFFRRRLGRIDGIINDTFTQLLKIYDCMEFKEFWRMVVDDVMERAWDAAHINREASVWADGTYYEDMLLIYLDIKEHHYKIEYNKRCK